MVNFWLGLSSGLRTSIFLVFVLIILSVLLGMKVRKLSPSNAPTGVTLMAVMFVEMVNNTVKDAFQKQWKLYAPLLMTILLYLVFANTASLWGLTPPLTNIYVALAFSVVVFVTIQVLSLVMVQKPGKRVLTLLNPLNLIGEITTPVAMGMRLFGNLLSGAVIGIIIYRGSYELAVAIFNWIQIPVLGALGFGVAQFIGIFIGSFIHAIFDIFFGVIQAYVFFTLVTVFLSLGVEE